MTIAVDLGRKATKQTNKQNHWTMCVYFSFDPDPTVRHTFWNLLIGRIFRGFGLIFNQSSIQRISATPTLEAATK